MSDMMIADMKKIISGLPKEAPLWQAAVVLTNAVEQERLTDEECTQILHSFIQVQDRLLGSYKRTSQYMDMYTDTVERLDEACNCANQAMLWLNDPLVKPVFILSVWIESALNWLFRRGEAA